MKLWLKLHAAVHSPEGEDNTNLAFPDFSGGKYFTSSRKCRIRPSSFDTICQLPLSSANNLRSGIRGWMVLYDRLCQGLSRSLGTAAQHYQAPMQRDSLATFRTIQSVIDGREGYSPTPKDSGSGQKTSDPPSQLPTAFSSARGRTSCPPKDKTAGKAVRAKRDRSIPPPTARPTPSPPSTPNPKRRNVVPLWRKLGPNLWE